LKWKNSGVSSKTIAIKLNETLYTTQTNQTGCFSLNLDLQPEDNKPTLYTITATFEDTNTTVMNATAWAYMTDGTRYAACTTVQYNGYKPSANTTTLTVTPRASDLLTGKSPEQLQKNMTDKGWLDVQHEFSWWYPWYRMHFRLAMNGATIDIGFTPMLPIFGVASIDIPHNFIPPIPITVDQEAAKDILQNIFMGTAVEVFGLAGTALAAPFTHLPGSALLGIAIYGIGLVGLLGLATTLYYSGRTMEALATLVGFVINGFGTAIGGLLGMLAHETMALLSNAIAFPILGAALSNMFNPEELISSVVTVILIACITFIIEYIIFHIVPDPLNSWFEPAFIAANFAFVAFSLYLFETWMR